MKVYVVMGNDFPECVYAKESDAEHYCNDRTRENKAHVAANFRPRIYWRFYEFELIR